MSKSSLSSVKFVLCFAFLFSVVAFASDWRLIGPEGGDVRSFAYDPSNPSRILLGTASGQMFMSQDGGSTWSMFGHFGPHDDFVLDHIIFDPSHPATVYVAAWSLYNADEGDVFRSDDGGATWKTLPGVHGKSIRTMAMAPSDPNLLVIGALDGVFRSRDGGQHWERISPENHAEIKDIESLAIDPKNPDIIYAGTWHLPWKTEDGGANWHSISKGIAYDSDMFSIIVDPKNPETVYASACSGIYKSLNKAEYFHRIYMTLPEPAHRTRVLKQDPQRPNTVWAGTAAGLWKTTNGGDSWKIVTGPDVVVNDVMVDPRNPDHVLAATDRFGVLASNNGFANYEASNRGFSHRVIGGVVVDNKDPNRIYVGVVNDKDRGGVFVSDDGGGSWRQSNRGLDNRDILSLQQTADGAMVAGTNHGIFYMASSKSEWEPATMIRGPLPEPEKQEFPAKSAKSAKSKTAHPANTLVVHKSAAKENSIALDATPRIRSLDVSGDTWYAATNDGLFISNDHGRKWYGGMVEGETEFIAVNGFTDGTVSLVGPKRAFLSHDQGKSWSEVTYPKYVDGLYNLTASPDGSLWLATREGALRSTDGGQSWQHVLGGLPPREVLAVRYDARSQRLLATAVYVDAVFESKDGGHSWQRTPDAGVSIRTAMEYQGRILAASTYSGLFLQQATDGGASAETAHAGSTSSADRQ